ncbi:DNA ligase 1 [Aricia agestis]|uniref:DNA ligase 1 n=1 Tax=Aricia agestis TaxID=91739 RepID=UPI001C208D6A|nr:DNA ligase 1 [Aricia agestis]
MNLWRNIIILSRNTTFVKHNVCNTLRYQTLNCNKNQTNNLLTRSMSQKSIKSFFKITPKKGTSEEEVDKNSDESQNKSNDGLGNGNVKGIKRSRSNSSEKDLPKQNGIVTPVSSEKKKKSKRQRIESSESESEEHTPNNKDVKIKLEEDTPPKSPKTPKTETTESKKSLIKEIKVEKLSPKTPKTQNKEPKKKTPSSKLNVKKENTKSNVKKENSDNKENSKQEGPKEKVKEEDYNPAKAKYHPINDASWSKGQEIPYLALAKTLEHIEATSARLKMVEILSNYLRSVIALTPEDLLPSIYLCLNQLAPAYHNLELGIAETYLMKAVGQSTGRTLAQVRAAAQRCGDLGRAAEAARSTQRVMFPAPPLTTRKVFKALKEIAACTGQASVNKKISKIQTLYVACRHSEARYLIRSLEGKLRVGLAEQSLLQALALACARTPPAGDGAGEMDAGADMHPDDFKAQVDELALIIKTTYCECPNYDQIVAALLAHGVRALPEHCRLTPGVPLKPMLAHPARGVNELFDRFEGQEFTCEWKYDGERAQLHVPGAEGAGGGADLAAAAIFSRNQENNTTKYPDVLSRLPNLLKEGVWSCVLDCEAVAYDTQAKQILPFQILSTRKRKDADSSTITVQVCVFVFDLLYLNGRPLVREPLRERRRLLRENFNEVEGEWQFASGADCSDAEEVSALLAAAVRGSCEGLMVKALDGAKAGYDIARRSRNWLKLKKDYLDGVGDTLDCVVIGAYHGRGRRSGAYGGFLLACYDPDTEQYQSLCKIGTGFTDDDLKTLSATLDQHIIDEPKNYYRYDNSHAPDAWFSAAAVWEVRCADLSLSPAHHAAIGLVDPDKGISLRFPRFVRVREDKSAEQATSARQVAELYLAQDQVKNSAKSARDDDDFY